MATDAASTIVLAHAAPFRLGAMEVRPGTREVIGPTAREVIEPRVMQVLVALASAKSEVVSRDDLIACCWDGRAVGEDAINRVISKIRRLGDTVGAGSVRLETITKVGYRLVTEDFMPAAVPASATGRGFNRRLLLAGGAVTMIGGGTAAWLALREPERDLPPRAAEFYDKGAEAIRVGLAENSAQGVAFLRQAVALAPNSAEAWGKLAAAYQISRNSLPPREADAARARSRAAVRRALELDPRNGSAHAAMAMDLPILGNWLAVEQASRKALALDPRQFEAFSLLGFVLWNVGRARQAIGDLNRRGDEGTMLPLLQYRLAMLLWSAGRLEESDRVIERAFSLWPRNYVVWFSRFWLLARSGRPQEALAMSANRAMRPTGIPEWNFEVNELTARALLTRDPADIRTAMDANRKAARQGAGFAENAMQLASAVGALDEAFELAAAYYFNRGFTTGVTRFTVQQGGYTPLDRRVTSFLFAPSTEAMRRDARFLPLARQLGLVDYWQRSGSRPDTAAEIGL